MYSVYLVYMYIVYVYLLGRPSFVSIHCLKDTGQINISTIIYLHTYVNRYNICTCTCIMYICTSMYIIYMYSHTYMQFTQVQYIKANTINCLPLYYLNNWINVHMHLLYVHLFVEDIYDMHNWHISLIGIRHIHTSYYLLYYTLYWFENYAYNILHL